MKTITAMKLSKKDNIPAKIKDNLYIGSIGAAYNLNQLQEHGITHIMTVAKDIKPRFESNFTYKIVSCLDT